MKHKLKLVTKRKSEYTTTAQTHRELLLHSVIWGNQLPAGKAQSSIACKTYTISLPEHNLHVECINAFGNPSYKLLFNQPFLRLVGLMQKLMSNLSCDCEYHSEWAMICVT